MDYKPIQAEQAFVPHDLMIGDLPLTITFPSGATLSFKDFDRIGASILMSTDLYTPMIETSITIPFRKAELIVKALPESMSWNEVYEQ